MRGIRVESQTPIAYGLQLRLSGSGETAVLNIYHSAKKGISTVIGAKPASSIKAVLESILEQDLAERPDSHPQPAKHSWHSWIGSDECGKGDYFGPLVVCAFKADSSMEASLRKLGVCDSKLLKDPQIIRIAAELYKNYPGAMSGIVLKPQRYNEIMADMKARNRNLNDLLAWQHSGVIMELVNGGPVDGILVDQFSKSKKVASALHAKSPELNVVERTGAESDPAVAAASILARYQFLQTIKDMGKRFRMDFPLGAGANVDKAAREFVKLHGPQRLAEVAKLHFKNSSRVL